MRKVIELENIWANYGKRDVLQHVCLDVEEKDFLGIIGPNGGGKTTLIKILLGLHKPVKGTIRFFDDGKQVEKINIGYLPQYNQIDRKFPISVSEVILSGLAHRKSLFSSYTLEDHERAQATIIQLGLGGLEDRPIGQLSGGQLQRVFLGRAIVSNPQVLVLDEPNTYLDREGEQKLYDSLQEINQEAAIILVSHDQSAIQRYAKRIDYVSETLEMIPKKNENL